MQENIDMPDLIWGADAIAAFLDIPMSKTGRMLNDGRIPATKVGRRWVAARSTLRGQLRSVQGNEWHNFDDPINMILNERG